MLAHLELSATTMIACAHFAPTFSRLSGSRGEPYAKQNAGFTLHMSAYASHDWIAGGVFHRLHEKVHSSDRQASVPPGRKCFPSCDVWTATAPVAPHAFRRCKNSTLERVSRNAEMQQAGTLPHLRPQ